MRIKTMIGMLALCSIVIYSSNFKKFTRALGNFHNSHDIDLDQLGFLYDSLPADQRRIIDQRIKSDAHYKLMALYLKAIKLYVPFDKSLAPRSPDYDVLDQEGLAWWDTMRRWYEQHSLAVMKPSLEVKIPKIIHQIWLGPLPFPKQFEKAQQSILQYHPGWEYRLWTDADVPGFGLVNKDLFDAAKNYGEKSDIFRYEVLERYGGVYLDVDVACLQPLDVLHHCYGFYTGIGLRGIPGFCIGIIACFPHHPIIKLCITSMQDKGEKTDYNDIIIRSGPYHFTQCVMQLFRQFEDWIALPPSYFYPIPNIHREMSQEENAHWARPESFTMHYWGCTWHQA